MKTGIAAIPIKALPRIFQQACSEWIADNATRLGASIAFYTLLSLAPLIVIVVGIGAYFYGTEAAQGRLASEIQGMAGPEVARTIHQIIIGAYQPAASLLVTLLGLATLAFGASSVFVELHDAVNTIWNVPAPRDSSHTATLLRIIRVRLRSFVSVLCIGFLLLISLGLNTWTAAMGISLTQAGTFVISYLVMAILFAALYKFVPEVRLRWSDVSLAAAITALLFMGGKQLLELYFSNTTFGYLQRGRFAHCRAVVGLLFSTDVFLGCRIQQSLHRNRRLAEGTGSGQRVAPQKRRIGIVEKTECNGNIGSSERIGLGGFETGGALAGEPRLDVLA